MGELDPLVVDAAVTDRVLDVRHRVGRPVKAELFTKDTLGELPWPDTEDGAYARDYLVPLVEHGTEAFVTNVATTYGVLLVDGRIVLPVSVNDGEQGNAWVCSPYTHYVTYAGEELRVLGSGVLRAVLAAALAALGALCRWAELDRVVLVNNWLLSTNLYPAIEPAHERAAIRFLRERFPGHAVGFCSVNRRIDGCVMVPGRRIYLVRPGEQEARHRKRWRRDLRLIGRRGYEVVRPGEGDAARVVELYDLLYLDKYSRNNPQFTERFVRETMRAGTITYWALARDGRIDGVLGYFHRDGTLTTPIFGYDTALPQGIGLYRMLSALVYQIAVDEGLSVNDSAGAGEFKRLRGAVPEIEYRAVYVGHLPWRRRTGWVMLAWLLDRVAVPVMRRYEL
ncbi:GNAT family N-acetyltransferase [Nonomuraea sp. NPDC049129]|uniref:GNAT family N-acetyltransferase n=1 Tax=Nonomuraea sp. NPDC049129 TaxID=3155272 RepID=UPI0033C48B90